MIYNSCEPGSTNCHVTCLQGGEIREKEDNDSHIPWILICCERIIVKMSDSHTVTVYIEWVIVTIANYTESTVVIKVWSNVILANRNNIIILQYYQRKRITLRLSYRIHPYQVLLRVTGRFGQDPFRPQFLVETSLISWTFRPQNINDSANKYERFGQINYIAAEMSLQHWCMSYAILFAAAIVTNVLLTICDVILSICDVIVSSLSWGFAACFRLPFLAFLSDVPKYLLVILNYLGSQTFCQMYLSIYLS